MKAMDINAIQVDDLMCNFIFGFIVFLLRFFKKFYCALGGQSH